MEKVPGLEGPSSFHFQGLRRDGAVQIATRLSEAEDDSSTGCVIGQ